MAFSSRTNFRALRSLSQALLRGYLRDRTALAFSILLPVLFLVLFGSLYRSSGAPKLSVIEIGNVSLLSRAASQPGLSGVLTVTHNGDKKAAVREVRRGNVDVAVEQMGNQLIVHYSIADPTTAGIVQTVFSSIVQQADQARAGPAQLPAGHQAGREHHAQADPVPRARPARLGHRLGSHLRRGHHAGELAAAASCCGGCGSPR